MVRDTWVTFPFMGPLASETIGLAVLCEWAVHGKWDSRLGWARLPSPCSCEALTMLVPLETGAA